MLECCCPRFVHASPQVPLSDVSTAEDHLYSARVGRTTIRYASTDANADRCCGTAGTDAATPADAPKAADSAHLRTARLTTGFKPRALVPRPQGLSRKRESRIAELVGGKA